MKQQSFVRINTLNHSLNSSFSAPIYASKKTSKPPIRPQNISILFTFQSCFIPCKIKKMMAGFQTQPNRAFLDWLQASSNSTKKIKSPPLLNQEEQPFFENAEALDSIICVPGSRLVSRNAISKG